MAQNIVLVSTFMNAYQLMNQQTSHYSTISKDKFNMQEAYRDD